MEELQQIADIIGGLSGDATSAFGWYLGAKLAHSVIWAAFLLITIPRVFEAIGRGFRAVEDIL